MSTRLEDKISAGKYARMYGVNFHTAKGWCQNNELGSAVFIRGIWYVDPNETPPRVEKREDKLLIRLPPQIDSRLESCVADMGLTKAAVIRQALIEFLRREGYWHGMGDGETNGAAQVCLGKNCQDVGSQRKGGKPYAHDDAISSGETVCSAASEGE